MNCHNDRLIIDCLLACIIFILLILVFPKWIWYALIIAGVIYCFFHMFKDNFHNIGR
ncbi:MULTISPECIES: hypothetical protein [Anaerofustis]|uniref:hypothetical protein n=1 Tax=Anaerofustis TaxID=264995 RepID=UPI001484CD1F|nr:MULTISPECIES: hypothetical protein [Anaerofustis]MCO8193265.1 hypothetical protein [Anaerofustis sp. NSJ-163]